MLLNSHSLYFHFSLSLSFHCQSITVWLLCKYRISRTLTTRYEFQSKHNSIVFDLHRKIYFNSANMRFSIKWHFFSLCFSIVQRKFEKWSIAYMHWQVSKWKQLTQFTDSKFKYSRSMNEWILLGEKRSYKNHFSVNLIKLLRLYTPKTNCFIVCKDFKAIMGCICFSRFFSFLLLF